MESALHNLNKDGTSPSSAPVSSDGANGSERPKEEGNDRLRVLLVEDQTPLRLLLSLWLERQGYHIRSAESICEAVALAEVHEFDILLADVWLPDGIGLSLLESQRERFRFGGISLSGFGNTKDFEQSKAAGFRFHLVKPFSPEELRDKIQMLVHESV